MSTNKKKMRLMLGICVPTASLAVAGGVTALVLGLNNNKPTDDVYGEGDYTVRFNAGEGKITSGHSAVRVKAGSKLEKISQPNVVASGKRFTCWKDESGKAITGFTKFNADSKLFANYVNENDTSYITITFDLGGYESKGAIIEGITQVSVLKNSSYFMVNRPSARMGSNIFMGWSADPIGSTTRAVVPEGKTFTTNTTLYPVFTSALQVTYEPNGGTIPTGKSKIVNVAAKTKFGSINPPVYTNGAKYLSGWYTDPKCTTLFDSTQEITADTSVYAGWTDDVESGYASLKFIEKGKIYNTTNIVEITASGYLNPAMKKQDSTVTWAKFNKPLVEVKGEAGNYTVKNWQKCIKDPSAAEESDWTDIADTATAEDIIGTANSAYIRPVFELVTGNVYIYTTDTDVTKESTGVASEFSSTPSKSYTIHSFVDSTASQSFTWTLTGTGVDPTDETKTKTYDEAALKSGGWCEITRDTLDTTKVTLTIYDKFNVDKFTPQLTLTTTKTFSSTSTKSATMKINFVAPWEESKQFWIYDTTTEGSEGWWLVNNGDLTSNSQTISLTKLGSETTTRTLYKYGATGTQEKFENQEIWIGSNVTSIEDNFLRNCEYFNGAIHMANNTGAANITSIGKNFMAGCSSYNQLLFPNSDANILKNVKTIGMGFMAHCTAFNNGNESSTTNPVDIYFAPQNGTQSLTAIGDYFFAGCTKLNTKIHIELATSLQTIGVSFMASCTAYDKDINFDNGKLTNIGDHFMAECTNFGATGTTDAPRTLTIGTTNNFHKASHALMSSSETAAINTIGFKVACNDTTTAGTTAVNAFCAAFPTMSSNSIYRKNLTSTEIVVTKPETFVLTTDDTFELPVNCHKTGTPTTAEEWTFELISSSETGVVLSQKSDKSAIIVDTTASTSAFKLIFLITSNRRSQLAEFDVINKTFESLEEDSSSSKTTTFHPGETFSWTGLVAKANFNSLQSKTISVDDLILTWDREKAMTEEFTTDELGKTYKVTVSYTYTRTGTTNSFDYTISVTNA